ncbi:hypothetical protein [Umezawaea sp. Da 62-37]|uniref:hypothetical protein n=1 Tax=Umezawaea sp. Da 62-37 TaxID=3075927 RepID=UPI0028F737C3|nr:hypothetical protein [Umezawaea sp. Da 62-37]WNV86658.1 hypothetical protein RM788_52525 [Umezawaea sp. Da 62-37]WNV86759.1 hypothetical protein RM788_00280 [Umezawaea sp. Da 62-37]
MPAPGPFLMSATGVSVDLVVQAARHRAAGAAAHRGPAALGLPGTPLDPTGSVQDTRDRVLTEHAHLLDRIALVSLLDTVGPHRRPDGGAVVTIAHVVLGRTRPRPSTSPARRSGSRYGPCRPPSRSGR